MKRNHRKAKAERARRKDILYKEYSSSSFKNPLCIKSPDVVFFCNSALQSDYGDRKRVFYNMSILSTASLSLSKLQSNAPTFAM